MKLPALMAFCLVLAIASCTKDGQSLRVNPKSLEGIWELREVAGGMIPADPAMVKPGNGDLWKFSQTEFARVYQDSLYRSGKYTISRGTGTDPNTGRVTDQFIFDQVPAESFELLNDSLRFYYGPIAADGVILKYVKISDDPTH